MLCRRSNKRSVRLTEAKGPAPTRCAGIAGWGWLLGAAVGSIAALILIAWWKEAQQAVGQTGRKLSPPPVVPPIPIPLPITQETKPPSPPAPDKLTRVKGIGPKISTMLVERGITTFEQLAQTDVGHLKALLAEWDWQFIDPASWPAQAREFIQAKSDSTRI